MYRLRFCIVAVLVIIVTSLRAQDKCFNMTMSTNALLKDDFTKSYFKSPSEKSQEDSLFWSIFKINNLADGFHSIIIDSSLLKMEGKIVGGKREGVWKFSTYNDDNYEINIYADYKNGIKNGPYAEFWIGRKWNGIKINKLDTLYYIKGVYQNDLKEGKFKTFHFTDSTYQITTFVNGNVNGLCEVYYRNGKLNASGQRINEKQIGVWDYYEYDVNEDIKYGRRHKILSIKYDSIYYLQTKITIKDTWNTRQEITFHPNNDTNRIENFVDSLKNGRFYYQDGVEYVSYYKNDTLDGIYLRGYRGNRILEKCFYIKGKLENNKIKFNYEGDTTYFANYKNGLLQGDEREYYDDGQLEYSITYKNGLREGERRCYRIDKRLLRKDKYYLHYIDKFSKDKLNGLSQVFYPNGRIENEEIYKNGMLYSCVSNYSKLGFKKKTQPLKNGNGKLKYSKYQAVFENGKKVSDVIYNSDNEKEVSKYASDTSARIFWIEKDVFYKGKLRTSSRVDTIKHRTEIKEYDRDGKIYAHYFENKYDDVFEQYTSYYQNGNVEETYYKDGNDNRNGTFKSYFENGKLSSIGKYYIMPKNNFVVMFGNEGSKKDSIWNAYYESGVLKSEEVYDKGNLIGVSKYYDETGVLKRAYHIVNDSTEFSVFNGDTVNYIKDGYKEGKWIELGESGGKGCNDIPSTVKYYQHGNPVGVWETYSTENEIIDRIEWRDSAIAYYTRYSMLSHKLCEEGFMFGENMRIGKWKIYDYKTGNLKFEWEYEENSASKDFIWYKKKGKQEVEYFKFMELLYKEIVIWGKYGDNTITYFNYTEFGEHEIY